VFEYAAGRPDRAARLAGRALDAGSSGAIPQAAVRALRAEALRQAGQPVAADLERAALLKAAPGTPWARAALDLCALEGASCADALDAASAVNRGPLGLVAAVAAGQRIAQARGARAAETWGKPLEATAAGPFWTLLLAHAHLAARDTAAAKAAFENAVSRAAARGDGDLVSEAALRRAALAYAQGDAQAALTWVGRVTVEKDRTLSCPGAVLTGYAHYRLGHAHEAALAFNYAQACAKDRGERGRLLALEARCRAQSGEYRLAAAVAGDAAADLEAAARGEGVGRERLAEATDVLEGRLELDVDRGRLARTFFFAQAAKEGWLQPTAEAKEFTGFPFRILRERGDEAPERVAEIESPASRSARLDALAARERAADRAQLVEGLATDLAHLSDSLRTVQRSAADSAKYVREGRVVVEGVGERSARAILARGQATALRARALATRAAAAAAELAPGTNRFDERYEALDRSALVRESELLAAIADSVTARAERAAAGLHGRGGRGVEQDLVRQIALRQSESRRLAAAASRVAAATRADAELAERRQQADAIARAAIDAAAADSMARLAEDRGEAGRALAHTEQLATRARADYEVALFERAAWSAIALDEGDSTAQDLAPAIRASDEFLERFPQSTTSARPSSIAPDLDVRLAYAKARSAGREPDFRPRGRALPASSGTTYTRKDAVLFNLAALAREAERPAGLRPLASPQLLQVAPASELAREAHVELGDRALDAERWAEAEQHFGRSPAGGGTLAPLARYKQGFAALKQGDAAVASEAFAGLLALPDLPQEISRRRPRAAGEGAAHGGGAPAAERFLARTRMRPTSTRSCSRCATQESDDGQFDQRGEDVAARHGARAQAAREPRDRAQGAGRVGRPLRAPDEREAARVDLGPLLRARRRGRGPGPRRRRPRARAACSRPRSSRTRPAATKKDSDALERAVEHYRELAKLYPRTTRSRSRHSSRGRGAVRPRPLPRGRGRARQAFAAKGASPTSEGRPRSAPRSRSERVAAADGYKSPATRDSLETAIQRFEDRRRRRRAAVAPVALARARRQGQGRRRRARTGLRARRRPRHERGLAPQPVGARARRARPTSAGSSREALRRRGRGLPGRGRQGRGGAPDRPRRVRALQGRGADGGRARQHARGARRSAASPTATRTSSRPTSRSTAPGSTRSRRQAARRRRAPRRRSRIATRNRSCSTTRT
jgi:hypothetical protein